MQAQADTASTGATSTGATSTGATAIDAPPPVRLRDRLDYWAMVRPDVTAVTFQDVSYTWAQWRRRILRLSSALRGAGLVRGDRIAVLDLNNLATLELLLAGSGIGVATVVVNSRLTADQIGYVLDDCRPEILFTGSGFMGVAGEAGAGKLADRRMIVGGDADEYEEFLASGTGEELRPATAEDVCLILYTSGTTGSPKGTELDHRALTTHSVAANLVFQLAPEHVNLVCLPLFHVGGTAYALLGIHAGASTVLLREPRPQALLAAIAAGATHTFAVPTIVHGVLLAGEKAIKAFGRLHTLGYGAAPMPRPTLRQALLAWPGMRLVQGYGMTELSGVVTLLPPQAHRDPANPHRLESVGLLMDGVDARVVDPRTLRDVAPGQAGELWFRTRQHMRGYLNQPRATSAVLTADGWIRTGDIGRIDADGFVYLLDRLKDVIITGGENVYCPQVENVLAGCPGVAEAAVIGVPDERWGETVKAIIVPTADADYSEAEIIAYCRARLAHFQCPTSIDMIPVLPRNGTGKVLKHVLRLPYEQRSIRRTAS